MEIILANKRSQTIQQLKKVVTHEAVALNPARIVSATQKFKRQIQLCQNKSIGHFEAEIKKNPYMRFFMLNSHS